MVFPEAFERSRDLLTADAVVAVVGKIDLDRGDPKLLADEIVSPGALPERPARAVHVRVSRASDEPALFDLRETLFEKSGKCALYLHMPVADGDRETVIQASATLLVSSDREILDRTRGLPCVEKVWTE